MCGLLRPPYFLPTFPSILHLKNRRKRRFWAISRNISKKKFFFLACAQTHIMSTKVIVTKILYHPFPCSYGRFQISIHFSPYAFKPIQHHFLSFPVDAHLGIFWSCISGEFEPSQMCGLLRPPYFLPTFPSILHLKNRRKRRFWAISRNISKKKFFFLACAQTHIMSTKVIVTKNLYHPFPCSYSRFQIPLHQPIFLRFCTLFTQIFQLQATVP